MSTAAQDIHASVVLNVQGLRDLAQYGFRSWLIQGFDKPYEVILNVFGGAREPFDALIDGKNPSAAARIFHHDEPAYFNISASNNYGLHHARGRYVLFANADIIYPGNFLQRVVGEMQRRDLCYAVASRVNLTEAICNTLKPAHTYGGPHAFDDLSQQDFAFGVSIWPAISPWMLRRDVALAIGGFDPEVMAAEDRDLETRAMHYLRRHNLQQCHVSFCDTRGYHLHHASLGAIATFEKSRAITNARVAKFAADPDSTDDIVPTRLDDEAALLEEIRRTPKPPPLSVYRADLGTRILRRVREVWQTILHGR